MSEFSDSNFNDRVSGWIYNELLFQSLLLTSSVMMRRCLVDQIGDFDINLKRGQDYDYWLRASRLTKIHKLDEKLTWYRLHSQNIGYLYPDKDYESLVVEKALKNWGTTGPDGRTTRKRDIRRHLSRLSFKFGYAHLWKGDAKIALRSFLNVIKYRPLYLKNWLYILVSLVKGKFQRNTGQKLKYKSR